MSNKFEKLVSGNPDKYPSRMGKKWDHEEISQLLESIKNNKNYEMISNDHQRTIGGISSQIKKLAVEYHIKGKPIEEIEILTKLTKEEINEAIAKQKEKKEKKESNNYNNYNDYNDYNDANNSNHSRESNNQTINQISITCNCNEELKIMKLMLNDIQKKLEVLLNV